MDDFHTMEWMREIHKPTVWYCDLDQHDYEEFFDAEGLYEHLLEIHKGEFTPDLRDTMVRRNILSVSRSSKICPLCAEDIISSTPDREPTLTESSSKGQKFPKQTLPKRPTPKLRFQVPENHVNSDEEDCFAGADADLSVSEKVNSAKLEECADRINHIKLATHVACYAHPGCSRVTLRG
jgi:hypothetical protein